MRLPDFLIVGAAKCGTTSLFHYMRQHPAIFVSTNKEPAFFAYADRKVEFQGPGDHRRNVTIVNQLPNYSALFDAAGAEQKVGEASVVYLYDDSAAARIHEYIPDVRLILILRDPVERAVSNYQYLRRDGYEPHEQFSDALAAEVDRIRDNWQYLWHYKSLGYYGLQVQRYLDLFARDQLLVFKNTDLKSDPHGVMRKVFEFTGVDESIEVDTEFRYNISGRPKSMALHHVVNNPMKGKGLYRTFVPSQVRQRVRKSLQAWNIKPDKPAVDPDALAQLRTAYRQDILLLSELLLQDFSEWL